MLKAIQDWYTAQPPLVRVLAWLVPTPLCLLACCIAILLTPTSPPSTSRDDDIRTAAVIQFLTADAGGRTPTPAVTATTPATATRTLTPTESLTPTITFTATITPTPTISPTPTPTLPPSVAACIPLDTLRQPATLLQIVDGDTITVRVDGVTQNVRYIGIDTPENGQPGAYAATQRNYALLANQPLLLVKDVSETDQYGRLLRYVIAGSEFVNDILVREGLALATTYPPDTACQSQFEQSQADARASRIGLWAPTATPAPTPVPVYPTQAPSGGGGGGSGGNCSPYYPTVCIPPFPPDLDCPEIPYKNFTVLPPDPHGFDRDGDGVGCES